MNPINKNVNKKEEQNQQLLAACQNIKNNNNKSIKNSIKINFTKSQIITNNISINSNNDSSIGEEIESNNHVKKNIEIKDNKKVRKKKYNKNNKSELRKELQYLEIYDNNKIWKYSIKYFKEDKLNIYYNCIDTKCKGTGIYTLIENNNELKDKPLINNNVNKDNFIITKSHTINYEDHYYNKLNKIKKDLEELSINNIKKTK